MSALPVLFAWGMGVVLGVCLGVAAGERRGRKKGRIEGWIEGYVVAVEKIQAQAAAQGVTLVVVAEAAETTDKLN